MTPEPPRVWGQVADLLGGAVEEIYLVAPFIKLEVFRRLVELIPASVQKITCVTRWSVPEIAAGVSDPEIIGLAAADARILIRLDHRLHAKLYMADTRCLVGSANLTQRATGLSKEANIEILIETSSSNPEVVDLLERLATAAPATPELAATLREQAELLRADERAVLLAVDDRGIAARWLPTTRDPRKLYSMYRGRADVSLAVKADLVYDLAYLDPPTGLTETEFATHVAERLRALPWLDSLRRGGSIANTDLQTKISDEFDLDPDEARRAAETVAAWLRHFDDYYPRTTSWELTPGAQL